MNNNRHVKGRIAAMMSLAVALALIAFVSPISAEDPVTSGDHTIEFISHTFDGTYSTWTYVVTSGGGSGEHALSHWILAWCNPDAMYDASEDWGYITNDPTTGATGIKFDTGYGDDMIRTVSFRLIGEWHEVTGGVAATTKDSGNVNTGYVTGPVCTGGEIPEFATIAIPIVALLGLVAFYRRKQKK